MNISVCNKESYKSELDSNLYDYLVIKDDNCKLSHIFLEEINKTIDDFSPDFIYSDYSIYHSFEDFTENVYCQSLIFGEIKKKPDFIQCPTIKVSVIRKHGIDLEKIIHPNNNLIYWHIPENLFTIEL